ncbi:MAG: helix-hairpin-helix domain-containing protein [Coriobacteriaceae bacterium]|jgi:competence protein ComEA|nr:helix-hairpin-helix domain-containing protein [Coriobacteriaceae bacterium]
MPFQESAESLKAKAHMSNVKNPVLLGMGVLVLVVVFFLFQNVSDLLHTETFALLGQSSESNFAIDTALQTDEESSNTEEANTFFIHIGGAVQNPGMYELEEGARVQAAVEAAGGFSAEASPHTVNLARKLVDGEQIIIPTQAEAEAYQDATPFGGAQGTQQGSQEASSGKVNINTATMGDLVTLPGIGEATAKKILADREANGSFKTVEEIMRVSGIGEKKFANLLPYITV